MPADPDATVIRPAGPGDATVRRSLSSRDDPDATVIVRLGATPGAQVAAAPADALPPELPRQRSLALGPGFRLHEYRIDGVLGQGGFGITYLATDVNLHAQVAIKEYLPEEIAFRTGDRSVSPNATRHRERYRQGLESFLVEARTLAGFRHPAIVRVARFFQAHSTAYMVLEYERGQPFKAWWPEHREGAEPERRLAELFAPLLDGLAVVHDAGFLHRDIKPDNIQVRAEDGRLVLLDFGSAGQTLAVADQAAVVVTPGYAPIEQYGLGRQGPWTDLYALGATLYWAVSGAKPPDAETRSTRPAAMVPAVQAGAGRYGEAFLKAIDWALETDPDRRPRSIAEWRRALLADHAATLGLQDALQSAFGGGHGRSALRRVFSSLVAVFTPAVWPLALKMTIAMLATALLPMALTGFYNLQRARDAVSEGELRFVQQLADSTAGRLVQFSEVSSAWARSLAGDAAVAAFVAAPGNAAAAEPMAERLRGLAEADRNIEYVALARADGSVAAASSGLAGASVADEPAFKQAMQGRGYAGGITVGSMPGVSGVFYAEPVAGPAGTAGAVLLRMRGAAVGAILDAVSSDAALVPFLVDRDGVLVYHPREDLMFSSLMPLPEARQAAMGARFRRERIESLDEPALAQAMTGAQAAGHASYHSNIMERDEVAGFAPVPGHDWVVGVTESRARFETPLAALDERLLWSMLLVGLLFAGLALRFARGIVRPLAALTRASDALRAGDYAAATVDVKRRDEVGQLARTFNVMIEVLRQRERGGR